MTIPAGELGALSLDAADAAVQVPRARPTNITRSVFHVASGLLALGLLRLLPGRGWLVATSGMLFVAAWSMELSRRHSRAMNDRLMRFFSAVAHPHERHQVNSSTWYVTALVLLALLAPLWAAEVGVVVLAAADPMAGLIGRRYGRVRLRSGRSLEGALAFLVTAALAGFAVLALFHPMAWSVRCGLAVVGAAAGAVAELFSGRLDDNFTIPVSVASAVAAAHLLISAA